MNDLRLRIPPNPRLAKKVRDAISAHAQAHRVEGEQLSELLFAVGEALANAIEYAGRGHVIDVRCAIDDDKIIATILDAGPGFARPVGESVPLPDLLAERGRGIPIMQLCTDIFAVHSVPGRGTVVVLGRYRRAQSRRRAAAASPR